MSILSRRSLIKQVLRAATAAWVAPRIAGGVFAQIVDPALSGSERGALFHIAREFMERFAAPALSVAISREGRVVYEHAFGMADRRAREHVSTSNLFRVASLAKPVTSAAIFTLVDQGRIRLTDTVFGESGVLGTRFGGPRFRDYVTDITVDDLLMHTCGGWPNDASDPMFRFNSWDHARLIRWTLKNLPLTHPPGQHWAYSNFGYCVLGRIIEAVSGRSYEAYVSEAVLKPCGSGDMRIAGNTLRQRAPGEVVYYGQDDEKPYRMNVRRMDSHGGWIASPSSLARFLNHVAGSANAPGLLRQETVRIMTTPSPAYDPASPARYARGWMVRNDGRGNWWHNGSLPGTTAIMVRTPNGLCWAALVNTRRDPSGPIDQALDEMMWRMVREVPAWGA